MAATTDLWMSKMCFDRVCEEVRFMLKEGKSLVSCSFSRFSTNTSAFAKYVVWVFGEKAMAVKNRSV